jgi:hypothetical protein
VCIVPERREEITTEGGLNLADAPASMGDMVATLKDAGIFVTAFLSPDTKHIQEAARYRFDAVEIHTGAYANASRIKLEQELKRVKDAAGTWACASTPATASIITTSAPCSTSPRSKRSTSGTRSSPVPSSRVSTGPCATCSWRSGAPSPLRRVAKRRNPMGTSTLTVLSARV